MKKQMYIIGVFVFLLSANAHSQTRLFNKNYARNTESFKLALIPINYNDPVLSDEILGNVFKNEEDKIKILEPSLCRQILDSDTTLTSYLKKVQIKEYKYRHLKKFPNLSSILQENEMDYLKSQFLEADLILIPLNFEIIEMGQNPERKITTGKSNFRLYDLNTGEFIFEFSHQLSFPKAGYEGKRGMTTALVLVTHKYFKEKLFPPL